MLVAHCGACCQRNAMSTTVSNLTTSRLAYACAGWKGDFTHFNRADPFHMKANGVTLRTELRAGVVRRTPGSNCLLCVRRIASGIAGRAPSRFRPRAVALTRAACPSFLSQVTFLTMVYILPVVRSFCRPVLPERLGDRSAPPPVLKRPRPVVVARAAELWHSGECHQARQRAGVRRVAARPGCGDRRVLGHRVHPHGPHVQLPVRAGPRHGHQRLLRLHHRRKVRRPLADGPRRHLDRWLRLRRPLIHWRSHAHGQVVPAMHPSGHGVRHRPLPCHHRCASGAGGPLFFDHA